VVGASEGGPGQAPLRYARRDAERVADALVEIAHVPRTRTQLLLDASPASLRAALVAVEPALAAHAARGERSELIFYYSGHARAEALNMGEATLPLGELRSTLLGLPATLTVVVLDACQSGSFSRVKGAAPSADFSFNSVRRLDTRGVAVLASSSGDELSQESPTLGASYFTHHLLVGLRGAGDSNSDGRVSLDEVYRYAYQNTLADTSATAVGGQHATLETELRGKGDVPLSYPADAHAHLALPAELEGELLVQQADAGSVMAELHKARGAALTLALPPGSYHVTVRGERGVKRCTALLADGPTELTSLPCQAVSAGPDPAVKGADVARGTAREGLFLEGGLRVGGDPEDAYTRRLGEFGFDEQFSKNASFAGALGYTFHRHLSALVQYAELGPGRYERALSATDPPDHFSWRSHGFGLGLRARLPLVHEWLALYAQASVGPSMARSAFTSPDADGVEQTSHERGWGVWAQGAVGFQGHITHYLGTFFELGYGYASALESRLGDVRNTAAGHGLFGIRIRTFGAAP
jgi:Caspase domain